MPRSRSRSLLSITRSATFSFSRKVPLWRSSWSTSVVLPWSTWAMMAMLRIWRGHGRLSKDSVPPLRRAESRRSAISSPPAIWALPRKALGRAP